ncbi:centlein-like [Antedon mediterranea]|uniref:centlein-like n=1 Tax=Antedon mediterranea TaxID=105859 RepID=UPI003AF6DDAE
MEKKLKEMMIPAVSTNNAETQVDSTATGTQVGSTASKTQVGSTATGTQVGSTASKTQVGSTAPGTQVGSTASNTRQASFTPEQIPITPHSHPQPLVVDHHRLLLAGDRVERSSRPRYRSQTFSGISVNDIHYSGLDAGTTMDEQIRHNLGRKEKKVLEENYERKMSDLRKLLKLKNEELETMRKVHKKRFDRLKILQENCSILREQISTYDEEELKTLNSRKHVKTSSKQLQQLNSDTVWNDLTFYKEKYTQLNNERIDIHEEIDTLQVQTTADASTIADLSRCLEQERLKLQACFEKEHKNLQIFQKEQRIFDDQLKKNKLLKQQLQQERNENKKLISDQIQLEREARSARADLCTVKTDFLSKETEVQHNKQEIHKLKRKMKRKNKKWKQYKADKHLAIKTPKQHQLFLNKSILKMRKVFPEFEDNEWEDVQSDSDDVVSSNPESLGQQIMRSANKLSRRNLSGLVKSPKSPRELISVETYLRRMAKAYKGKEAEHTIQISVATQTERVQEAEIRFLKESLLEKNDEIASMTDSEGSSLSTIVTSSPKVERQHTATSPHLPLPKLQKLLVKTYCGKAGLTDQNICSLKNRLASLQQQVIATKRSKRILQQSVEQLTAKCELLQADLSLSNQRLKISKETIKRLTREVEQNNDEAELVRQQVEMCCKRQTSSTKQPKHTDTDWKELELRAKNQSIELSQRNVVVKTLKSEIESQAQQIKTLQDRISHNERDLNQKRSLMEDLRARVKASTNKDKSDNVYLKDLEDKLQDVSDACEKRKVEVNSLRKRLTTVTKEKHTYEVVNQQLQDELKTFKAELRKKTTEKNEADKMVVDLEATAVNQLQSMSEHIEKVIASAEKKIEQEVLKHSQLKLVLEMLAGEFLNRTKDARELAHQIKKSLCVKVKMDESMTKAQSIASSILYLTASDVEELMTLEDAEEHKRLEKELIKERRKDEEWMKLLESLINSQTPLAQKVFQMLMDKIIEHDKLLSKVEKETT